jgi:3D (Asp-Asp-Asp) domain-containing protein
VLGQAHTPWRRFWPLAAIALAVLAAPAVGGADSAAHGPSAAALRAENARLAQRSRAAVLELYSLDEHLAAAQTRLTRLQHQAAVLRSEQQSLVLGKKLARHSARDAERRLASRLRLLYEQGDVEPLEVVLGSRSLDDAISNLSSLTRVASQGERVLRQLHAARRELSSASVRLRSQQRALSVALAEAKATAGSLGRTIADRTSYIHSLASKRRLNEHQIDGLLARAHAAQLRSAHLTAGDSSNDVQLTAFSSSGDHPAPLAAPDGSRTLVVSATAYSLPGYTSSGLPVGPGVVAVDPSVIPLGTRMTVEGYGEAIAADTGTAIIGNRIDLWFPTYAQAAAWGRRTVTVTLH